MAARPANPPVTAPATVAIIILVCIVTCIVVPVKDSEVETVACVVESVLSTVGDNGICIFVKLWSVACVAEKGK